MSLAAIYIAGCCGLSTPPGVIRLTDAASGRPVILVGSMHYNPHSINMVRSAVDIANRQHGLHAMALELCSSRWNSTSAARWQEKRLEESSIKSLLSEDEFQVAWESSVAISRLPDVVLADQPIAVTGRRLGVALASTAVDLFTPAGWRRVGADLLVALRQLPTFASAAVNGPLLAGAPLAAARYLYQSPSALPFLVLSTTALGIAAAVDEATGAVATWEDAVVSGVVALIFGRAAFVSLIKERDRVLAQNIRDACLMQQPEEGAVVAVLGMAHLAGVREALLQEVEDRTSLADPREDE